MTIPKQPNKHVRKNHYIPPVNMFFYIFDTKLYPPGKPLPPGNMEELIVKLLRPDNPKCVGCDQLGDYDPDCAWCPVVTGEWDTEPDEWCRGCDGHGFVDDVRCDACPLRVRDEPGPENVSRETFDETPDPPGTWYPLT